jgi:hypothetical protein
LDRLSATLPVIRGDQELRTEGWRDLANSMKFDLARRKLPSLDSPEFPEKAKSERAE